jgi:hypothetical protein
MPTLLPSAPEVLGTFLRTQPDLAAIHGGRVGTRLAKTLPAIRLQRIGAAGVDDVWEDRPSMQVECWAANEDAADTLVRTLLAVLPEFRHRPVVGGRAYTYEVTSGPYWAPDDPDLSSNARYILTVSLLLTS